MVDNYENIDYSDVLGMLLGLSALTLIALGICALVATRFFPGFGSLALGTLAGVAGYRYDRKRNGSPRKPTRS